jgi:arylsulfatase A-like enzyme
MKNPNILFIMTDQLRYDCLGCNGNSIIKTPNIDKFADQSANFSSFFVQAPVCVPSRQTFFSGLYPHCHKNRVNYTSMDNNIKLMQRYFQEENYFTAFIGKLHYYPPTREYALSTGFDYGLIHDAGPTDEYSDYVKRLKQQGALPPDGNYRYTIPNKNNPYTTMIADENHETTWCGIKTIDALRTLASKNSPFFLFS